MSDLRSAIESLETRRLFAFTVGVDPSFGDDGLALFTDTFSQPPLSPAILVAPVAQGKLLVAGPVLQGSLGASEPIARFNGDGTLDKTYAHGVGSIALLDVQLFENEIPLADALLQPDGGVIIVAKQFLDQDGFSVQPFTSDGEAGERINQTNVHIAGSGQTYNPWSAAQAPDGKIITAGTLIEAGEGAGKLVLTRLTPDGALDTTFDTDGKLITDLPDAIDYANLAIQSDGKIIALGASNKALLARYNIDGTLDTTFGDNGFVTLLNVNIAAFRPGAIVIQPDDKIVVAGGLNCVRLMPDGQLDSSFGDNGVAGMPNTAFPVGPDAVNSLVIDSAGRIIGAGEEGVFRFNADGTPDETFGIDGGLNVQIEPTAVNVDQDDNVLIAGRFKDGDTQGLAIQRLTMRGQALGPTGLLVVTGTDGDDDITVDTVGDQVLVNVGGDIKTFPAADVKEINLDAGDGKDKVTISLALNSSVAGGAGDDSIVTNDGSDTIDAGDGDDSVAAGGGKDRVLAGAGDNTVNGEGGDDVLIGAEGNDHFDGGDGDDRVLGGDGDNVLIGGDGNDSLQSGEGRDSLFGEGGKDQLRAGLGSDLLSGGGGKDRLFGQQGRDRLYGGANNDQLDGGPGNDRMFGQDGDDKLFGGQGDDQLTGGDGNDFLYGIGGIDSLFANDGKADTVNGGGGEDQGTVDDSLDLVRSIESLM
jgi:uncharacterized delta-60 repeat protein